MSWKMACTDLMLRFVLSTSSTGYRRICPSRRRYGTYRTDMPPFLLQFNRRAALRIAPPPSGPKYRPLGGPCSGRKLTRFSADFLLAYIRLHHDISFFCLVAGPNCLKTGTASENKTNVAIARWNGGFMMMQI